MALPNNPHRERVDPTPQVLLVNPATTRASHKVFEPNIYPNMGLVTLGTSLQIALRRSNVRASVLYYDGSLLGDEFIRGYIAENADRLSVIGYSACTLNYRSCVALARHAKSRNANIVNIIGNDHFSALYQEVMERQQGVFDYGFYGNDVVEGFARFVLDILTGKVGDLATYAGMVFRDPRGGGIKRCPENPEEFANLPMPDYSLLDSLVPHADRYHREQLEVYPYARAENRRMITIEIARGCLKFGGRRNERGIPLNACDFCAIVPGSNALIARSAERAWDIIRNAYNHGYNYLFVTADELPSTFWPLLRGMADRIPEWYLRLKPVDRPRMMGYARADAFRDNLLERIDLLMNTLGYDHFFVGLDGFSSASLRAMNKGINRAANHAGDLFDHNLAACREIARRGGKLSSGMVITHIGITAEVLEANFQMMREIMAQYPNLFVELDFEMLCPIPGSLAFEYLRQPDTARARAKTLGVNVNDACLEALSSKYRGKDDLDPQELAHDFVRGCCPDITVDLAHEYLGKIRQFAVEQRIVYDSANIAAA